MAFSLGAEIGKPMECEQLITIDNQIGSNKNLTRSPPTTDEVQYTHTIVSARAADSAAERRERKGHSLA